MTDKHEKVIRALYRQTRTEQPSEFVDKRIRKAARRALYRNRKRWLWTLSTAAVIVLSFSVVLKLYIEEPDIEKLVWSEEPEKELMVPSVAEPSARVDSFPELMLADEASAVESSSGKIKSLPEAEKFKQKRKKALAKAMHQRLSGEMGFSDSMTSPVSSEKDNRPRNVTIPHLPVTLKALIQLDESLHGEELDKGLIKLYSKNSLILTVSSNNSTVTFNAWPGSEILGIGVDWSLTSQQLKGCSQQHMKTACQITNQLKAIFIEKRLDHIRWTVTHE